MGSNVLDKNNILANNSFSGSEITLPNESSNRSSVTSSTSKSNGNNSTNQKRGAERLFQYFEADDSDPEDYARYFCTFYE